MTRTLQPDFQIGDHVVWLPDGDIGLVVDVDHSGTDEPYNVEWYLNPTQSGWHSTIGEVDGGPAMVLLGG